MTVVADSSSSRARGDGGRVHWSRRGSRRPTPGRLLLAGLLAALRASVIGLACCVVCGLLLSWSTGGPTFAATVGLGGDLWLAAHLVPLVFAHGTVSLLPVGFTVFPLFVLFRAGRRLAQDVDVAGFRQGGLAVAALAVPYLCAGLLVATSTLPQPQHASLAWAPLCTGALALLAGGLGVVRGAGLGLRVAGLIPAYARPVLVASTGAVATLVAVGSVLVVVMVAVHALRVGEITGSLHAEGLAGVLLFLIGVAYVPNAVVFTLGYVAGPGFSLGAGTVFAPGHVEAGPLPAFPLLAAVPSHAPPAAWLVLAAPVLAGVVAGTLLVRHTLPRSLVHAAGYGLAAGAVTGAVVGILAVVASGSLGGDRLASLGPDPLLTGLLSAAEVGVLAAAAAVLTTWVVRRRVPAPLAAEDAADDVVEDVDADQR